MGYTQGRRASESKIPSRHLPHGSGDVGLDEGARPVHEVQEHLVLHPRGHRPAAEARGRAAVGMDRRSAAKGVTDLYHEERPPVLGNLRRSPMHVGPRRPTSSARPFDGTTGGRGNAREPMDTRWPGSGGPATILYLFGAPARRPSSTRRGTSTGRSAPTCRSPWKPVS